MGIIVALIGVALMLLSVALDMRDFKFLEKMSLKVGFGVAFVGLLLMIREGIGL